MIDVLRPQWPAHASVRAATTLRSGGVSVAPFDTLNLGTHVGDDPHAVAENRRRVRESLHLPSEPVWLAQVHGATVISLDETSSNTPPRADAAVARTPGHVCVIQVADCMPVLLAARDGSVIGAAHAGWRGLANGVLEATITAMNHDPADLLAWLGPAIGPAHFEVGDDVRDAFLHTAATRGGPAVRADNSAVRTRIEAAFTRNSRQRWQCDLYALARLRLETRGISQISGGDRCTYTDRTRFFSYRRDGRCGRMAALIWLAPS